MLGGVDRTDGTTVTVCVWKVDQRHQVEIRSGVEKGCAACFLESLTANWELG